MSLRSIFTPLLAATLFCNCVTLHAQSVDSFPSRNAEGRSLHVQMTGKDGRFADYRNQRFGFLLRFPAQLLMPQGEADNGDGQIFLSRDKQTELTVFGSNNASDAAFKKRYDDEIRSDTKLNRTVTFKTWHKKSYVVSGFEAEKIFYVKAYQVGNQFIQFSISYPQNQRETWDKVVAEIAREFKETP